MSIATHENPVGTICPKCSERLDCSSGLSHEHKPAPGDLSVCLECGTALVFNDDLTVRAATLADRMEWPESARDELVRIQSAIHARGKRA